MPQVAAVPLFTIFTGGAATTITLGAVAGYLATTAITSWAISALTPKPNLGNIGGSRGTLVNSVDPAAPHEYVYGLFRKGGIRTYTESTGSDNKYLHMIISLAGHEIDEFVDFYVNDEIVTLDGNGFVTSSPWNSKIRIKAHDGSQTTADPDLLAESNQIDANFVGHGIAYLYVRLEYDQNVFANGVPLFTALVRGRKVYDPRTDATAYSANAALCIRDYLTSDIALNDQAVDDTIFAAQANVCDEDVDLATAGVQPRYECNGVVSADMKPREIVERMITACAGTLFWGQGNWQLRVGYYTPPVKTFTLSDLRSEISIDPRIASRDNFNRVVGTFSDADADYVVSEYPSVESATFLAEDAGVENTLDLTLPFTTSAAMAQRLAKLTLYRGREQITITGDFGLEAFEVQAGDIVAFTNERYGWTNKEFEVQAWNFQRTSDGQLITSLTLRETSEAAFDWNAEETEIINNNTSLLKYTDVPTVGLNATATTRILNEKVTNFITATVTASSNEASLIDHVEVQFKQSENGDYKALGSGQLGLFEAVDLDNGSYDFRARAVNGFGYYGEWNYLLGVQALGDTDPPDSVSGFSGDVNGQTITLSWEPVANPDLSFYRIRHAIEETAATWANATTAVDKIARPGTSAALPIRAGTYMIRAYDKEGMQSPTVDTYIVPAAVMPSFANTSTQTDTTTFGGTKTGCSVSGGRLLITDPSTAPSEATYEFANIIDSGSVGRRFCRIRCGTLRNDASSGLWDDMPGLWDSWGGLWDDWTGFSQFDDTNVLFYIATSEDAPGSPTWSDWQQFRAGDFYGRLFKFKIVLKSSTNDVTPSIGTLEAIVEWN